MAATTVKHFILPSPFPPIYQIFSKTLFYTTMKTVVNITALVAMLYLCPPSFAFVVPRSHQNNAGRGPAMTALDATVGIFFGTSTGSTQEVADLIKEELGDDAEGPFDIETLEGSVKSNFEKYDALIVGSECHGPCCCTV
jgi:Flavodoxin